MCNNDVTGNYIPNVYKFSAPEVLGPEKYDRSCDMWSLGVIMYILWVKHHIIVYYIIYIIAVLMYLSDKFFLSLDQMIKVSLKSIYVTLFKVHVHCTCISMDNFCIE